MAEVISGLLAAVLIVLVLFAVGAMIFGYPAMYLWNYFAPALAFGMISYWQAVAMLIFGSLFSLPVITTMVVQKG